MRAAVFVPKGGSGKTTTTGHLGVTYARAGLDVLLIDLAGNQGDLAKQFGLHEPVENWITSDDDWPNISTVFQPQWRSIAKSFREERNRDAIEDLLWDTDEGPDLIPAHPGLDTIDGELRDKYDGETRWSRLNAFIDTHVATRYDIVLIDLPGDINNLSMNGIYAGKNVITPVQPGAFESSQAERFDQKLTEVREKYGRDARIRMLLPNEIDIQTNLAEKYLSEYAERFGDVRAPAPVPKSQAIRNTQDEGRTIFTLADDQRSNTATRSINAYETNAVAFLRTVGRDDLADRVDRALRAEQDDHYTPGRAGTETITHE